MATITASGRLYQAQQMFSSPAATAGSHDTTPTDHVDLSPDAQSEMNDPAQWQRDQAHIQQVGNTSNPDTRNRDITKDYSQIGTRIHDMMGDDGGANWSTFAAYASSRAGQTIRGEDKPGPTGWKEYASSIAGTLLGGPAGGAVVDGVLGTRDAKYATSRQAVGDGNKQVYQDIAPQLQRFADTFQGDKAPNQAKWDEFAKGFGPDQGEIKDGLHEYYQAMFDNNEHSKQEHILNGNLLLAQREQELLDPTIKKAMPGMGLNSAATRDLMSLQLPSGTVGLGQDVPALNGQQTPAPLTHLGDDPKLTQQIQRWGGQAGDTNVLKGSAAGDWSNLSDRMKYITALMRSRQDDPSLYTNTPQ